MSYESITVEVKGKDVEALSNPINLVDLSTEVRQHNHAEAREADAPIGLVGALGVLAFALALANSRLDKQRR